MKRILNRGAVVLFAALVCAPMTVAAQSNQTPAAFFGTFTGTGVAKNRDSIYFAVIVRDLDVKIGPAQGGLSDDSDHGHPPPRRWWRAAPRRPATGRRRGRARRAR